MFFTALISVTVIQQYTAALKLVIKVTTLIKLKSEK